MDWIAQLELDAHWWWFILAVILGVGEIIAPGVFLIWIAMAAGITGVFTWLTGVGPALQFLIFAVASGVMAWAGRRWYLQNPVASSDPLLNDRTARLIGQTVIVVEPIAHGRGRVKVGDSVWPAAGPDAPEGAAVRVTGFKDGVLVVENLSNEL